MTQQQKDLARSAKVQSEKTAWYFVKHATFRRLNNRRADLIYCDDKSDSDVIEQQVLQTEVIRITSLANQFMWSRDANQS